LGRRNRNSRDVDNRKNYITRRADSSTRENWNIRGHQQQSGCQNWCKHERRRDVKNSRNATTGSPGRLTAERTT
jgi:hypothetical protein